MAAKAVQVSIDEALLRRIDADPEAQADGRSAFVRSAVVSYLRAKQRRQTDEAIAHAYQGVATVMLDEVADLLEGQSWPVD